MSDFKTIEPKPGVIILPIIVPEAYHDCTFKMFTDNELMVIYPSESYDSFCALPEGNWIPLGISTELTEEQCAELVPLIDDLDPAFGFERFMSYKEFETSGRFVPCATARKSFASFMQANGMYEVNPYGDKPTDIYGHEEDRKVVEAIFKSYTEKWQEAEANTGKYLILKLVE